MNIGYLTLSVCCLFTAIFMGYFSSVYAKGNQFPQTVVVFSLAIGTFVSGCVFAGMVFS